MTIVKFPPIVHDGDYRIRSADRTPDLYLEWQSDNSIKCMPLKANSDLQKWSIKSQPDSTYLIQSVEGKVSLCVKTWTDSGTVNNSLSSGTLQYWTIEPRGDNFVIGVVENYMCVDIATNDVPIIWERRNAINQRWILESVAGTTTDDTGKDKDPNSPIAAGIYNIRNRATNGQLSIWTGYQFDNAPILVWPYAATSRLDTTRAWTVSPSTKGIQITNSMYAALGARSIREGPYINVQTNFCKLIAVPGTQYFHIATSTAKDSRVIMDSNPTGVADQPTTMADFNADDVHQHWEFIVAP